MIDQGLFRRSFLQSAGFVIAGSGAQIASAQPSVTTAASKPGGVPKKRRRIPA
jgi:hypothetical protein